MDKDNLDVRRIFTDITTDTLESLRSDAQQQTLSALFLTIIGLILTLAGFVAVLIKLGRLANCSMLLLAQRLGVIRRVASETGRSKLQKICTDYDDPLHIQQQTHPADNLKQQKMNYSLRNFTQRKRLSAHTAP